MTIKCLGLMLSGNEGTITGNKDLGARGTGKFVVNKQTDRLLIYL